jgi:hypothetical protein
MVLGITLSSLLPEEIYLYGISLAMFFWSTADQPSCIGAQAAPSSSQGNDTRVVIQTEVTSWVSMVGQRPGHLGNWNMNCCASCGRFVQQQLILETLQPESLASRLG